MNYNKLVRALQYNETTPLVKLKKRKSWENCRRIKLKSKKSKSSTCETFLDFTQKVSCLDYWDL